MMLKTLKDWSFGANLGSYSMINRIGASKLIGVAIAYQVFTGVVAAQATDLGLLENKSLQMEYTILAICDESGQCRESHSSKTIVHLYFLKGRVFQYLENAGNIGCVFQFDQWEQGRGLGMGTCLRDTRYSVNGSILDIESRSDNSHFTTHVNISGNTCSITEDLKFELEGKTLSTKKVDLKLSYCRLIPGHV